MRDRLVPTLGAAYFLAMLVFVTYPGYVPFNRIRPFVLGLPFSLFWQVLWISGAVLVLTAVFVWEQRRRDGDRPTPRDSSRPRDPEAGAADPPKGA